MQDFIRNMPKVELHAHLNGSLSTETLLELGSTIYGKTTNEFQKICDDFKQIESFSLKECFKKFQIAHELTATKNGLGMAAMSVIRDFAQDKVVYLELRSTPRATADMSKCEYLRTILDTIRSAKLLYPDICVNLLPSIDRSKGIEAAKDTLNIVLEALKTNSDVIKGIDLSGDPTCGKFDEYKCILTEARDSQLKLALHCAEIENNEETHKMLQFGMERCGHGTFMSAENINLLKENKIPIECCLTSNIKCGTVKSYKEHHFQELFLCHHPVVLCTDDSGVFDTSLSDEFIIAQKSFDLSLADIRKLLLNAVESSFADKSEKTRLLKFIEDYFNSNKILIGSTSEKKI